MLTVICDCKFVLLLEQRKSNVSGVHMMSVWTTNVVLTLITALQNVH